MVSVVTITVYARKICLFHRQELGLLVLLSKIIVRRKGKCRLNGEVGKGDVSWLPLHSGLVVRG